MMIKCYNFDLNKNLNRCYLVERQIEICCFAKGFDCLRSLFSKYLFIILKSNNLHL